MRDFRIFMLTNEKVIFSASTLKNTYFLIQSSHSQTPKDLS